jgi:hypothetical protein
MAQQQAARTDSLQVLFAAKPECFELGATATLTAVEPYALDDVSIHIYIYVLGFFNRIFRVAKKVDTLSGFFLLYESVPHAITPRKNTLFHSKSQKFRRFRTHF